MFPNATQNVPAAPANSAVIPQLRALRVKQALKALAADSLAARLQQLFGRADAALLDLASSSHSNKEHEILLNTVRQLRQARSAVTAQFCAAVEAEFEPDAGADDRQAKPELSLMQPEQLAKRIAVLSMIMRAQGQYQFQLWEIDRRIGALAAYGGIPFAVRAITPEGLCESLQKSVDPLGLEAEIELAIYRLFDRLVLTCLSDFYAAVLLLLRRECQAITGVDAAPSTVPAQRHDTPAPAREQRRKAGDRPPLDWLF